MAADSTPGGHPGGPRRAPVGRYALRLLVRVVALVLAGVAVAAGVDLLDGEQIGANIGAGLLGLGAALLVSVLWAFRDGRSASTVWPPVLLWVAVLLVAGVLPELIGIAGAALFAGEDPGMPAVRPGELLLVLVSGVPFTLVAAVPAVLAALLGHGRAGRP